MGLDGLGRVAVALPEIQGANEGGDSGSDVYDRAAGEIEGSDGAAEVGIQQAAFAPDHMCHGEVNDEGPQRGEHQHGAEFHALGIGARNEGGSDDGEHELIDHECGLRDGGRVIGVGVFANAVQEQVLQASDEGSAFGENEAVAGDRPDHCNDGHHDEAMHHGAEHILSPYKTSVKERETWTGHHENQSGAHEHPGVVARRLRAFSRSLHGG